MQIYKYNNEPEAQKIKFLLENEKIPCEIHSFENWGYDGIFRGQIGMGEVIVPDEFSNKAKKIISEFLTKENTKPYKEDKDLRIMKLAYMVKSHKTGRFVYVGFIIVGAILLIGFKSIIGAIISIAFTAILLFEEAEVKSLKRELQSMESKGAV